MISRTSVHHHSAERYGHLLLHPQHYQHHQHHQHQQHSIDVGSSSIRHAMRLILPFIVTAITLAVIYIDYLDRAFLTRFFSTRAQTQFHCVFGDTIPGGQGPNVRQLPHAARAIFPCWSAFLRRRERHSGGVVFNAHFQTEHPGVQGYVFPADGWVGGLLRAIDCRFTVSADALDGGIEAALVHDMTGFVPHFAPRPWFEKPADAAALRETVLKPEAGGDDERVTGGDSAHAVGGNGEGTVVGDNEVSGALRIGLVHREKRDDINGRFITNLGAVERRLRQVLPSAEIDVATMNGSLREQAQWWNRHNVVALAHGAAVTNAVFLRDGAAVIEIFPPQFTTDWYELMVKSTAVRYFPFYTGDGKPMDFWEMVRREKGKKLTAEDIARDATKSRLRRLRDEDITLDVGDIVGNILKVVEVSHPDSSERGLKESVLAGR